MSYLGAMAHALGDRCYSLAESAAAGRTRARAEDLHAAGFRRHHVCAPRQEAFALAAAATEALARQAALDDVDAILYSTCLPANGNAAQPDAFARSRDVKDLMDFPASRLQAQLRLDRAIVIGINQQACTGLLGAVRIARGLLATEPDWQRVLVVTADRFPPGSLYEQGYNLISDGAAACLVTRQPAAFRILACHHISNGALGRAGDDETVGSFFSYVHRCIGETVARAGLAVADVDWIVPQNTHDKAWPILARLLGIAPDRIWCPSLPDVGHVISADNVINLAALAASGRLRAGDRVLLVMAGFGLNWQCTLLEAT